MSPETPPPGLLAGRRARRGYTRLALLVLDAAVAFLLLNLVLAGLLGLKRAVWGPDLSLGRRVARYGFERVARAYPGWRREDLEAFLREDEGSSYQEYEPFTDSRPRRMKGRFVNVSEEGYRLVKQQGPWPPDPAALSVFLFGGSTAYGLHVPDDQTVASHLQEALAAQGCRRPVRVYNFGRPAYFSTQERILFEQLLLSGRVPQVAVFLDGLNELFTWPRPVVAESLRRFVAEEEGARPASYHASALWRSLPLARAAAALADRWRPDPARGYAQIPAGQAPVPAVIAEWRANKALIEAVSERFGVRPFFVWQPAPFYQYDLTRHVFHDVEAFGLLRMTRVKEGYEEMERLRRGSELSGGGFLWLADIQRERRENLYVSSFHYNGGFAKDIAIRVADHLWSAGLPGCADETVNGAPSRARMTLPAASR